jgi:hypothetical protein
MATFLQITQVPPGEAPLWVREQWVGLVLPLAQRRQSPLAFLTSGVVSGPKTGLSRLVALLTGKLERQSGYRVDTQAAVSILAARSPEAAAWWRDNAPHVLRPGRSFVFHRDVGRVVADTSSDAT